MSYTLSDGVVATLVGTTTGGAPVVVAMQQISQLNEDMLESNENLHEHKL